MAKGISDNAFLLESVIANANDGIVITSADLDEPGPKIIYVNPAITEITGYEPDEIIGKTPRILQGPETDKATLREIRESLEQGKAFKGELLNYDKQGQSYWLGVSIVPLKDPSGKITHFAAIERDITDRKNAEKEQKNNIRQLKRANLKAEAAHRDLQDSLKRAEESNKSKSDFLANMSHELRTPMNGVLGMAYLLSDTELTDEQKECVQTINGSAETLLMLLNDILDFSKIEANALVIERIPYSFSDVARQTMAIFRQQAQDKDIDLNLMLSDRIPETIEGDPGRMRQILTNLIGNALKFTDDGSVDVVAKTATKSGIDILHVEIKDTGIGIPEDKQRVIFEKFSQADTSVTRKFGGTGLGLAITKQLAALMEGDISVESEVGKGSTFKIEIPYKEVKRLNTNEIENNVDEDNTSKNTNRIQVSDIRVLLVDDFPINRVFAEKLIKKFGMKDIDIAEDGLQAVEHYKNNVYDLVLMDCQMPNMDGYQATQTIRKIEAETGKHVPIVAMTANAMLGDREKCLQAGMDEYISKPLKPDKLRNILSAWINFEGDQSSESQKAAVSEHAPVDLGQIRSFTNGDPEEERVLIDMFLDQAVLCLNDLSKNMDEQDSDAWKLAAHSFKGASGNFGANRLSELCKKAEQLYSASTEEKAPILNTIKTELDAVEMYLRKAG